MNETAWDPNRPIFRQVRDGIASRVLTGELKDGEALPSLRQLAGQLKLSPLTVLKAYQQLVDEQLIEKQRGRGMFIRAGGCEALRRAERERFLSTDWPRIRKAIERLGLSAAQLLHQPSSAAPGPGSPLDER
jgi:GntR family transcriptional regulator